MTLPIPLTPEQADRKRRSSVKKWNGNDRHSYALFVDGRPRYDGMDKREADWRREKFIKEGLTSAYN